MPEPQQISFEEGISRKDLKTIRRRFMKLHRERLRRILGELRPSQQEFITLLPLLFHINHPMLPGFVNSESPAGIPDFGPSQKALTIARKLSRSFSYKKRAHRTFLLEGLYLMGSTGTIAQSAGSDFDVWLCHTPSLSDDQRRTLQEKAERIEKAADELDLELHIFLIDPEDFRAGKKAALSRESSGSTQHSLLLEEFYRSAVLLAGRYPLWWLVPPDRELDYRNYADNLISHRFVNNAELLDFGGLDQTPADEFFGAALWQLYKGIDSPYKSILKIFLMEAYSRDFPHPLWLAQQAKAAIYAGEDDLNKLDAYILLYRRVEEYLIQLKDEDRLELARRCFYFKVGETLSRDSNLQHWRAAELFKLTREWGWSQTQLQILDTRADWKIDQVIRERNVLVGVLSRSYRLLTDFARTQGEHSRIDPMELNLLGRKLYAALDHHPGKVDSINPGISKDLSEPHLSLHHRRSRDGSLAWMLYQGTVDEEEVLEFKPIKITLNLIEILLWSHINQVWNKDTIISLYPAEDRVSRDELIALHKSLRNLFPSGKTVSASMKNLSRPAYPRSLTLFINLGTDPLQHLAKEGKQLTSDRHDPLSFGAARNNLVLNLEELVETSWGELLITRHEGADGLLDALCQNLNLQGQAKTTASRISSYSFSSIRGSQIASRVTELFQHIIGHFQQSENHEGRFAFRLGHEFYMVQQNDKDFAWRSLESFESLLEELEQPQQTFRPLTFDPRILTNTPYPTLFQHSRRDFIQIFYQVGKQQTHIYLLDEQGALFQQTLPADSPRFLMRQQRRFLNSLQQLRSLMPGGEINLFEEPRFYELKQASNGDWRVEARRVPLTRPDDYMELSLVTDSLDATARPHSLICGDQEFSRLEYGEEIYTATAIHLQGLREGNQRYPIYLTSLRLAGMQTIEQPRTVELLQLKKRVEQRLNRVLDLAP
ncbi:MAG: class I adenylate cyclase [Gammaproteobacteria bacterium]|nr:class I adenylate cyclase [Gammaproteobacteria bacterium]